METVLLDTPREVDVNRIERELVDLWKDGSSGDDDAASRPMVRACSLNFIAVTEAESDIDAISEMVGEVTIEHPSRIFLILADRRTGKPSLDAWISARCSVPVPGGKQVCCEQINLFARGGDTAKIPSIVTSLLVPDVPTFLLWKAKVDARDSLLWSLTEVSDRVLIDSSEELEPHDALTGWHQYLQERPGHSSLGDLAWTHLTPWRFLVANAFNVTEMRKHLNALKGIEVEFSQTKDPRHSGLSQALLFIGWLVHRLGWILVQQLHQQDGGYAGKYRVGEQAISLAIRRVKATSIVPGRIESISIHSALGLDMQLRATVHRNCVESERHANGDAEAETLTAGTDEPEAVLVAQELEMFQRDGTYESALAKLAESFRER